MKQVKSMIKLLVKGGEATPAPPIGPSLAQHGINIAEFCARFNEQTRERKGELLPAVITVYEDRTFEFIIKKPPVSALIKKVLKIEKGSKEAGKITAGKLAMDDVKKIAEDKMEDLIADDLDAASRIVMRTAKSMCVKIEK